MDIPEAMEDWPIPHRFVGNWRVEGAGERDWVCICGASGPELFFGYAVHLEDAIYDLMRLVTKEPAL